MQRNTLIGIVLTILLITYIVHISRFVPNENIIYDSTVGDKYTRITDEVKQIYIVRSSIWGNVPILSPTLSHWSVLLTTSSDIWSVSTSRYPNLYVSIIDPRLIVKHDDEWCVVNENGSKQYIITDVITTFYKPFTVLDFIDYEFRLTNRFNYDEFKYNCQFFVCESIKHFAVMNTDRPTNMRLLYQCINEMLNGERYKMCINAPHKRNELSAIG